MVERRSWPILRTVCLLAVLAVSSCHAGGLMVTTPRVWVAGGQENVCIVSHALISEVLCTIQLQKQDGHSIVQKNETLASGGSICIEVPVPQNISVSSAKLSVTARSVDSSNEYNFSKSADITIQRPAQMTFIETDKPIYKPGDLVRIRILTLNGPDLKILRGDIALAYIEDPSRTRVMQWENVSTVNGLGSLEMQLSDEPRLGQWTIKASIKGEVASQTFNVEEYVLPKFEVTILHPSYLLSGFSMVKWKVCARYTYGQPVNGNVSSSFCLLRQYRARTTCNSLNAIKLEDGCAEFFINSSEIDISGSTWDMSAKFFAEVNEDGTGVKLNSTFTAKLHQSSMRLKFIPEDSDYKPGLPYYGQGQVTRPDGSPVAGHVIHLRTEPRRDGGIARNLTSFPVLNLTTDENGYFKYFLPGTFTSQDMNSIHQHVTVIKTELEGAKQNHGLQNTQTLKAWYSPSRSFLQIEPFEGIASCQSSLSLPTAFVMGNWSESPLTFYFQLISRGDIVHAGQLTASSFRDQNLESNGNGLYKFNITFTVTPRMSGSLKILVFTVLESGETVAESMLISVEQCFHNKVSMGFTDQQKQPGHPTTLRLSADPHSLCSISVVDKSVKLMEKEDGSLSKSKVFGILKQYDIPQDHYSYDHRQDENCAKFTQELDLNDGGWRRPRPRGKRMIIYPGMTQSEYVDSKKAFMDAGMVILSDLTVVTRPCSRRFPMYYSEVQFSPMRQLRRTLSKKLTVARGMSGPIPLAEASVTGDIVGPPGSAMNLPASVEVTPVLHRSFFPESWLWQIASVGDSGTDDINLNLPHTITEWIGNGFCTNDESGLGVTSPFSINAFQPFFLSFTLPYSMIRGERVGIPVSVFNYMNQCLKVTLHVQKSTAFELKGESPVKELRVCAHQTETLTYYIVPRELGNINFTVKASSVAAVDFETNSIEQRESMTAEDIVTQKLLVEAEGKEEEQTKSAFICAPGEGSFSIGLPDGLVEDSLRSFTSIIGDVMGPTLTGLESLLALPTGCGEQNMLKFSPNIFVMQYLQKTNILTEDIRAKATEFLQTGYQRELTYRHKDGSYSAFGESDGEGSIWLTAFVVKSFAEAKPFIYIDQKDLQKSIKWITSIQLENGCFPQVGRVLHKEMKGGMAGNEDNFAALTAYVLIALLEAGLKPQDPVILRGVQCLEIQRVPVSDTYTRSLMAYAYTMWNRNETKRTEIMDSLASKAVEADGMKHWNKANDSSSSPAATEMTSYVLLAMLHDAKEEVVSEATPIVRWLSTQRNARGGFSSTQDTVLALQALAEFAALTHRDDLDVRVALTGRAWNHNVSVTNHNRLLLQKQEGQTLPSTLKYSVSGSGCVLLQASVKYNIINYQKEQETAFQLKVDVQRSKSFNCKERGLKICTSYNGVDNASNMAVIAVKMVSGWIPEKDSIKKLSNDAGLRLKRFEIEKNIVHLYFEELDKTQRCFTFLVHQNILVTKTKSVLVHVYDYYKPSLSAYDDYSITTTCGTKEEIREEGNASLEPGNMTQFRIKIKPPKFAPVKEKALTTKKPTDTKCPKCEWKNLTEVKEKYCNAPHAYDAVVINRTSLNVLKAVHSNVEINKTVSYRLAHKCVSKCAVLKKGEQVVLMLPKPINRGKKPMTLKLDVSFAVVGSSVIRSITGDQNTAICS